MATPAAAASAVDAAADAVFRRVSWRLLPLLCFCIVLNYLDRTSLAFAAIQMTEELGFGPEVLGLGGGLFFLTYCASQVPANLIAMRVGVRWWLAAIMLCWGAVAGLFAAVRHPGTFYCLRLLLGLAEAGTFPSVWLAISLWFPPARTSTPFAIINASVAISQVLAAPIAAALLRMDGTAGLSGWQWVFLGEALPSCVLALALPWLLPNGPDDSFALGLSAAELDILRAERATGLLQASTSYKQAADKDADRDDGHGAPPGPDSPAWATATAAAAADRERSLSGLRSRSSLNAAAAAAAAASEGLLPSHCCADTPAAAGGAVRGSQQPTTSNLRVLLDVAKVWQLWYLAAAEALKGSAVLALMLWLPVMVQSLLSGGDPTQLAAASAGSSAGGHSHHGASDSTGALPVLLSAVPFSCAAVMTSCLGAAAQRTGGPLVYFFCCSAVGGVAFMLFPVLVHHSRAAGFALLVVSMACGYSASPHPLAAISQLLAARGASSSSSSAATTGTVDDDDDAAAAAYHVQAVSLALPAFNSLAMLGGFVGPWVVGWLVERMGGFGAASVAMGGCMLAAGGMVCLLWLLQPQMRGSASKEGPGAAVRVRRPPLLELTAPAVRRAGSSSSGGGRLAWAAAAGAGKSSSGGGSSSRNGRHRGLLPSLDHAATEAQQLLPHPSGSAADDHDADACGTVVADSDAVVAVSDVEIGSSSPRARSAHRQHAAQAEV